jgi:phage RecT family recombinase
MTTSETAAPTNSQALTTSAQANPVAKIKDGLDRMTGQIKAVLPAHIPPERFNRVVMTAVNNNPELVSADRQSLFNACIRAATDGLVPDGREGALVIFKDKTGKKLVQWMPMVGGLLKLIRQSGEIDSIGARVVYQNEIDGGRFKFVIEDGKEKLFHDPMLWGERGQKVLVYAYARFKESGYVEYAVLHKQDVDKRRAASRSSSTGPWASWETEMWIKTALRFIAKRLPLSSDIMEKIDRDEAPTHFDEMRTAAIAQLGQQPVEDLPAPEDEVVDFVTQEDEIHVEPDPEALFKDAEEMVDRQIIEILAQTSKEQLDAFAVKTRAIINEEPITDEMKQTLIRKLNTAYYERTKVYAQKR